VLERVADYARVSQTFHDHPVFGLGPGASIPSEYGYLDNQWLQEIVQGGSVGLAAMTVLASAGIFGIAAALRDATTPRERDQAYTMGAMLIGILASSYTFDLFTFTQVTMLFFILFGLLWSNFTISTHARTTRAVADRASFASYRASHGHYSTDADSFSRGRTVERGWLSSWRRLHLRQWFSGSAQ
jgi:O-antigen ligase